MIHAYADRRGAGRRGWILTTVAAVVGALCATGSAATPTTGPSVAAIPQAAAATRPVPQISEAARAELDRITQAYRQIKSIELDGVTTQLATLQGETGVKSHDAAFTSSFEAPNRFRHTVKEDVDMGSTGKLAYSHLIGAHAYATDDAVPGRVTDRELPPPCFYILEQRNLSMALVLVDNAAEQLTRKAGQVDKIADTLIDGKACPTLRITYRTGNMEIAVNPDTHLIRRVTADNKLELRFRGVHHLQTAQRITNYTAINLHPVFKKDHFAWTIPPGLVKLDGIYDKYKWKSWEGKTPPDFTLTDLNGNQVKLSDLKGKVVFLDFWATWCPLCLEALPYLTQMHQDYKDQGFEFYAIDVGENKEKAAKMLVKMGISPPVLLDDDSAVSKAYRLEGYPSSMLIGRDGIVYKTFAGPPSNKSIREERTAAEAALKAQWKQPQAAR